MDGYMLQGHVGTTRPKISTRAHAHILTLHKLVEFSFCENPSLLDPYLVAYRLIIGASMKNIHYKVLYCASLFHIYIYIYLYT